MVIGIDIRPLLDKRYSGVALYTLELLKELFKQDTKNEYRLFYNSFRKKNIAVPEFSRPNVRLIQTRYPNKLFNYVGCKILRRPYIDKILGADIFFMPHINFAALSKKCPRVVAVHDLSFMRYPYFFTARKNIWHRAVGVRRLLRRANSVAAVSGNTKNDIIDLCGIAAKKIFTVYPGIGRTYRKVPADDKNLSRVRAVYRLPNDFILYLGNIEPRKNIESIIEAYLMYRAKNTASDIKLVIAGAPAWKHRVITAIARGSRYSRDIIFTGYIAENDKLWLYNLAALFVFPSFYEGFGFPPLEAAACGTPVIASNTSSLPEISGGFALLVNPYNINELSEAIETVLSDPALRAQLREKGLRQTQKYTWEKCARQMLEIFRAAGGSVV